MSRSSPILRQLGVRYIEAALTKAAAVASGHSQPTDLMATQARYQAVLGDLYNKMAADIRPGDAKPPAGADRQANSLGQVVNQLQANKPATGAIQEENAPRVLSPQQ